ncbi:hypothetical protein E2C01_083288 [Portunus trituberculatus]|uniref:Uncharacterized protein n=1 Tax=Portunus trituberculatus TaxID=210409 RepID=A0A5B7J484_PORTR|nr:hypothetical protein [Portunus trituberculatus]
MYRVREDKGTKVVTPSSCGAKHTLVTRLDERASPELNFNQGGTRPTALITHILPGNFNLSGGDERQDSGHRTGEGGEEGGPGGKRQSRMVDN